MAAKDAVTMISIAGTRGFGVIVSVVRMKVVSMTLGPSGIALLTNLNLLVMITKTLFGLGVKESSVREIAQAYQNPRRQDKFVELILLSHLVQVVPACVILLTFSVPLSSFLLDTPDLWWFISAASAAVFLEMLVMVCGAAFLGTRRTVQFANTTLIASILATVVGSVLTWEIGRPGLLGFIISQPLFTIAISFFRWKRPLYGNVKLFGEDRAIYLRALDGGIKLMLAAILVPLGLLAGLSIMTNARGTVAAGQYAAAVSIATQYVGLFIAATGNDFYPKLSEQMAEKSNLDIVSKSIDTQTRTSLALFTLPLYLMILFSEHLVTLLLSSEFRETPKLLGALIIASLIQLSFTPISYSLVAGGHHKKFLLRNAFTQVIFIVTSLIIFTKGPLFYAAIPFILMNTINASISIWLSKSLCSVRLSRKVFFEIAAIISGASLLLYASQLDSTRIVISGLTFGIAIPWCISVLHSTTQRPSTS